MERVPAAESTDGSPDGHSGAAGSSRLRWYANRLTSMSPAEVGWRVGRVVSTVTRPAQDRVVPLALPRDEATWSRWLEAFRRADGRAVVLDRARAATLARSHPEEVAEVIGLAEAVLAGRYRLLGAAEVQLATPPDWHHDVTSGHHWPLRAAHRIDHRTAAADPKWIWELNRLQHLPWLAEAWLVTGRDEFAAAALEQLDSWVARNPVGEGIAWRGAFEVGLRSISVLVALQGLRDSPLLDVDRFRAVVEVLEASGRRCWSERSRFSSANNHLVGELTGLVAIGALLPELPRASAWVRRGVAELARQADLQVLPDGAGAEQSLTYQLFTAEFLALAHVLCRGRRVAGADALAAAVRRSNAFLHDLVHPGEPVPRHGDDDQGFVLRLDAEQSRSLARHLDLTAAALGEAPRGLAAAWLAPATSSAAPAAPSPRTPRDSFHAPDGGLVVLRSSRQRVSVDVGPLGYLALAAHGHADTLQVTLALDGRPVVDDPGTGSYYAYPSWRRAHRGTRAHATVTVDGLDQSVIGGPFLWSHHARCTVREVDLEAGVVEAEHDGYERLDDPVVHRRRVRVDVGAGGAEGFVVLDALLGAGSHDLVVSWPLAPDLDARALPDGHLVVRGDEPVLQLCTVATVPLEHGVVRGDEQSDLGWWSDRLDSRRPASLLGSQGRGVLPVVAVTVARRPGADGVPTVTDLAVEVADGLATATWREGGQPRRADVGLD